MKVGCSNFGLFEIRPLIQPTVPIDFRVSALPSKFDLKAVPELRKNPIPQTLMTEINYTNIEGAPRLLDPNTRAVRYANWTVQQSNIGKQLTVTTTF